MRVLPVRRTEARGGQGTIRRDFYAKDGLVGMPVASRRLRVAAHRCASPGRCCGATARVQKRRRPSRQRIKLYAQRVSAELRPWADLLDVCKIVDAKAKLPGLLRDRGRLRQAVEDLPKVCDLGTH